MNLIFFGRLAREKGFDLVVGTLSEIVRKTTELPGNIFIFGEGDLKKELFQTFDGNSLFEDCSGLSGEQILEKIEIFSTSADGEDYKIYFFGWQSQETVRSALKISHFSLMPSRFLETFGLSALESLSEGVPVIGFRKGGLIPFIHDELAISFSVHDDENIKALTERIMEVSEKYSLENNSEWKILSYKSRHIADIYTEERWMEQVREILPKDTKKILIVSDYTTILGGIETHVQTIVRTLRQHGYEVEIFGWNLPKGRFSKLFRFLGLVYSLCNISSALQIRKKIREFEPDVVWFHSVSRFLGPLVIWEVNISDIFSMITYHDLGLVSPFPSRIENEDMIPENPSLGAFLNIIHSKNPIVHLIVYCKYFQVSLLRGLLQKIHIHIVPSYFLVPYICNTISVSEEKIQVLEHFL